MAINDDPATRPVAATSMPDGSLETAEYLGVPGERVLSYLRLPPGQPRAADLICSPLRGEFARNDRRETPFAPKAGDRWHRGLGRGVELTVLPGRLHGSLPIASQEGVVEEIARWAATTKALLAPVAIRDAMVDDVIAWAPAGRSRSDEAPEGVVAREPDSGRRW